MMVVKRVLIIDPDSKFRRRINMSLKNEGYIIEASNCLTAAMQRLVQESFHCVIMDVNLPEVKGYEAVSILKNMDPLIKIIMMTNKNTKKLEAKVRNQDIYYYFIKSFGIEELKTAINSLFVDHKKEAIKMEKTNSKAKILVIDDDDDFREAVTTILSSAQYEVVTAINIKEAEQKIHSEKPNLILLDIMMDSLFDGFSLCHSIKTSKEYQEFKKVPIIFVSAVKEKTGSRFAFKPDDQGLVGPDDYMDKPVRPDDLIARVEKLLDR